MNIFNVLPGMFVSGSVEEACISRRDGGKEGVNQAFLSAHKYSLVSGCHWGIAFFSSLSYLKLGICLALCLSVTHFIFALVLALVRPQN